MIICLIQLYSFGANLPPYSFHHLPYGLEGLHNIMEQACIETMSFCAFVSPSPSRRHMTPFKDVVLSFHMPWENAILLHNALHRHLRMNLFFCG